MHQRRRDQHLRRHTQRFGCRHSQSPIEFPCNAPQWYGKSPKQSRIRRMSDNTEVGRRNMRQLLFVILGIVALVSSEGARAAVIPPASPVAGVSQATLADQWWAW